MRLGAPRESCSDLAPVILAFSNLVRLSGPIITLVDGPEISWRWKSISSYVTTSSFGRVLKESSCIEFPFPPPVVLLSTDFAKTLADFFLVASDSVLVSVDEIFLLLGGPALDDFCFFLEVTFLIEDCFLGDSLSTKNKAKGK